VSTGAPETVWVLGAGFSRSLGGPLLDDLFGADPRDIAFEFPDDRYRGLATTYEHVRGVFEWGKLVERKWADAEQFLVFVDEASADAARQGPSSATFRRICYQAQSRSPTGEWTNDLVLQGKQSVIEHFVENARRLTRQALAVDCTRFLLSPDTSAEAWLPYQKWAASLRDCQECKNTVITFNYDRVPEYLGKFWVPLPNEAHRTETGPPWVLKLHGSVDWHISGNECHRVQHDLPLRELAIELALAAPGRSKAGMTNRLFRPLWDAARKALETANAIVFLGYSFPPTDALARQEILSAIARNTKSPLQHVDIVLGEDLNAPRSRRLKSLVEASKGGNRLSVTEVQGLDLFAESPGSDARLVQIVQHPLRAEDYLDVHQRFFDGLKWS